MALKKIGDALGSNEGGQYLDDTTGKKHYIKFYNNGDQAKVEALTGQIYHHMGINTLKPEYKEIDGKPAIATEWNDNLKAIHPREFENLAPHQATQLGKIYHAAVLTKNWDVVGLSHDNLMKDDAGNIHSVDQGGSFHFRAQGGPKDYDPNIGEHKSLVHNDGASGHVFRHLFNAHPNAYDEGRNAVVNMNSNHIYSLFQNSGLSNWKDLHKSFIERRHKLVSADRPIVEGKSLWEGALRLVHPKKDDRGNQVFIERPSSPSGFDEWDDPKAIASTVPNGYNVPHELHGVKFHAIRGKVDWKNPEHHGNFVEPPIGNHLNSSGVIAVEPDGRVWINHPTNQFGGYEATFPKGKYELGLSSRENAIKEAHEETGIHTKLIGHLGDFKRTTSTTRYYLGKRIGGHPADMGWETQKVSLVPIDKLHEVVTHPVDQPIVEHLQRLYRTNVGMFK